MPQFEPDDIALVSTSITLPNGRKVGLSCRIKCYADLRFVDDLYKSAADCLVNEIMPLEMLPEGPIRDDATAVRARGYADWTTDPPPFVPR